MNIKAAYETRGEIAAAVIEILEKCPKLRGLSSVTIRS